MHPSFREVLERQDGIVAEGGMLFSVTEGGASLMMYTGNSDTVCVPDSVSGAPVVSIDESAFSGNLALRCVSIPGSVRDIGDSAFEGCSCLQRIYIQGIPSFGNRCLSLGTYDRQVICEVFAPEEVLQMLSDPRSWAYDPDGTFFVPKRR
ncbi:hypothetical protein TALC_00278 [Thermoplasmatales archaeon BRNA1]|nr:hypothetical protein TALC_00278 [Thermoplasmatales archaeon BRNA1]